MREVRTIADSVRRMCEAAGYGEIATPALEYEQVLLRGDHRAADPAYRLFDEQGNVLVLRSDMTIPIARVVASRYPTAEPPLRFCYVQPAYRVVKAQRGHPREVLQAGVELIGAPAPDGTAEALSVLCSSLDAAGLRDYRVGLGDAALYPTLLERLAVPEAARTQILHELVTRDFVGLEREVRSLDLPEGEKETLITVPQTRGGPEVLAIPPGPAADALTGLQRVHELVEPPVAERLIFDLGLSRTLGYYTGAIFEVYDPALGLPLGGGGRYDDLLGRFGRPLSAVGWAIGVEQLHMAVVGER